ncbi:hypothetical protein OG723_44305 (plasmid) [Streptomyces sp. NBC_01278]|uniref:hypothetical protein n=1 Tax=Streptomyces sp. NBC_01278 TaxID=2903809 RepID=UPI002E2EF782|nr:hypothetical protein [Streptomyces sp. NBC_01278]
MLVPPSAAKRLGRLLDGEAPTPHDDKTLRAVLAAAALRPAPLITEASARRVRDNSLAELRRLRAARRGASADAGSRDGLDEVCGDAVTIRTTDGRTVRAASSIGPVDEEIALLDVKQAMNETRTRGSM